MYFEAGVGNDKMNDNDGAQSVIPVLFLPHKCAEGYKASRQLQITRF